MTDQGYNEVMSYGDNELQRWENSKKVVALLERAAQLERPMARRRLQVHGGRESLRTGVATKGARSSQTVAA